MEHVILVLSQNLTLAKAPFLLHSPLCPDLSMRYLWPGCWPTTLSSDAQFLLPVAYMQCLFYRVVSRSLASLNCSAYKPRGWVRTHVSPLPLFSPVAAPAHIHIIWTCLSYTVYPEAWWGNKVRAHLAELPSQNAQLAASPDLG